MRSCNMENCFGVERVERDGGPCRACNQAEREYHIQEQEERERERREEREWEREEREEQECKMREVEQAMHEMINKQ